LPLRKVAAAQAEQDRLAEAAFTIDA
jgi:hypothetical protein